MPPLRIGLIGCGGISRAHLPAFLEHRDKVELVAVCDIREEAARAYAADAGLDPDAVSTSAADLLAREDIEAVDIATIHDQHAPNAIAAARAGKHVLLEKPMACSIQEAREIVAACDSAGVVFMVAQMLRYLPHYQNVKRIIESGELGEIWACRADSWFGAALPRSQSRADWWGLRWQTQRRRQRHDGQRPSGRPAPLLRRKRRPRHRPNLGRPPPHAERRRGPRRRPLRVRKRRHGHAPLQLQRPHPVDVPVPHLGTKGTIYTDPPLEGNVVDQHHAPARIASEARETRPGHTGVHAFSEVAPDREGLVSDNPFTNEIVHFARCIREGKEPISSGRDNLNTMEAVHGVYAATAAGHAIEIAAL